MSQFLVLFQQLVPFLLLFLEDLLEFPVVAYQVASFQFPLGLLFLVFELQKTLLLFTLFESVVQFCVLLAIHLFVGLHVLVDLLQVSVIFLLFQLQLLFQFALLHLEVVDLAVFLLCGVLQTHFLVWLALAHPLLPGLFVATVHVF